MKTKMITTLATLILGMNIGTAMAHDLALTEVTSEIGGKKMAEANTVTPGK